jgi:hypothetical protein
VFVVWSEELDWLFLIQLSFWAYQEASSSQARFFDCNLGAEESSESSDCG